MELEKIGIADLMTLEKLLARFRDTSIDREEFDKRESLRSDVEFEIAITKENEASEKPRWRRRA